MPNPPSVTSREKGLQDYAAAVWRRKWTVLVITILAVAITLGLDSAKTKRYTSTTQVLLATPGSTSTSSKGPSAPDVPTDIELMTSSQVKHEVKKKIGAAPGVNVTQVNGTDVVTIGNTTTKPDKAAEVANAYANAYLTVTRDNYLQKLHSQIAQLDQQVRTQDATITRLDNQLALAPSGNATTSITNQLSQATTQLNSVNSQLNTLNQQAANASAGQVIDTAKPPSSPSSPKTTQDALFAFGVGLIVGLGVALIRDHLDDRIRSRTDLEVAVAGVSTIGLIPEVGEWRDRKRPFLASKERPKSPAAEAYRSLRTAVNFMRLERPIKLLQVTSAAAADGKTTTAANLAVAMAQAGQRVVIVGCDLRKPRLGEFFQLDCEEGLTTVLAGEAELESVLVEVPDIANLAYLPSGPAPPNPSEMLSGSSARAIFARLAASFDIVVIDTTPVLPVTDGSILAAFADAVLLVAAADISTSRDVRRAVELLYRVNANLVGTVLNRASQSDTYVYYRYSHSRGYGYGYPSESRSGNGTSKVPEAQPASANGAGNGSGALRSETEHRGSP